MLRNAGVGVAWCARAGSEESHDEDDVVSGGSIRWHHGGGFHRSGGMMMRWSLSGEVLEVMIVCRYWDERERERERAGIDNNRLGY